MGYYAVVNVTASGVQAIIGDNVSSGAVEWRINGTHQELLQQSVAVIATGTTTLTAGWHTLAFTYNQSTGAYALYICTGGTCNSDGSGSNAKAIGTDMTQLGAAPAASEYFASSIAEIGFNNSATIAGVGAWSSCKFAI
jgi:hypothetical protein